MGGGGRRLHFSGGGVVAPKNRFVLLFVWGEREKVQRIGDPNAKIVALVRSSCVTIEQFDGFDR